MKKRVWQIVIAVLLVAGVLLVWVGGAGVGALNTRTGKGLDGLSALLERICPEEADVSPENLVSIYRQNDASAVAILDSIAKISERFALNEMDEASFTMFLEVFEQGEGYDLTLLSDEELALFSTVFSLRDDFDISQVTGVTAEGEPVGEDVRRMALVQDILRMPEGFEYAKLLNALETAGQSGLAASVTAFALKNGFNAVVSLVIVGGFLLAAVFLLLCNYHSTFAGAGKRAPRAKAPSASPKKKNLDWPRISSFLLNYALYIILLAILIIVVIIDPKFLAVSNLMNILKQSSTKGILALGCAGLIVLAGTDLSIGRVLGLSAAVTASLVQSVNYASRYYPAMTEQLVWFMPLLAAIVVAVIFSLINGFGVAHLKMHAFIISLGTQLVAYGATCLYIEGQSAGSAQALAGFDSNFLSYAAGDWVISSSFKIPLVVLYFLGIAAIMWVIWNKTRLGKNMFAVGGNQEAAAVSGVSVAKTIMLVYLMAGVLYGVASFLEAARIQSVGSNTGINYELDAISACVIGGVSFSGGVGTIQGVVIGAIILQAINFSLNFLGVNAYFQYIIRGLIIVLAVAIDVRKYLVKK